MIARLIQSIARPVESITGSTANYPNQYDQRSDLRYSSAEDFIRNFEGLGSEGALDEAEISEYELDESQETSRQPTGRNRYPRKEHLTWLQELYQKKKRFITESFPSKHHQLPQLYRLMNLYGLKSDSSLKCLGLGSIYLPRPHSAFTLRNVQHPHPYEVYNHQWIYWDPLALIDFPLRCWLCPDQASAGTTEIFAVLAAGLICIQL